MIPRPKKQDRTITICNNLFDACFWGILIVAPLFMGGRGPFGRYVLVILVALMAIAWCIKTAYARNWTFHFTGAEWILLLGLGLLCLQITPLPENVLLSLSPGHRELLPIWFSSTETSHLQIGYWDTLSLAPTQTREAMGIYLTLACFFVLLTQRIDSLDDVRSMLNRMSIATAILAILALGQYFWSNGRYLWIYEHPTRSTNLFVTGTFQNKNHFAHMMALGLGPLIWCALSKWRSRDSAGGNQDPISNSAIGSFGATWRCQHRSYLHRLPKPALALAIVAVILASLLTFSRGGILATSVAGVLCLCFAVNLRSIFGDHIPKWWSSAVGILLGIGIISSFAAYGFTSSSEHLPVIDQLSGGRIALWQSMLEACQTFWLTGTGIGSHVDVYPIHMNKVYSARFSHGESGYIPLLMEGGITAIFLLICAVAFAPGRLLFSFLKFRAKATKGCDSSVTLIAPILAGLSASLVQSIGDFVWYITACMSWTIILLAIACRLPSLLQNQSFDTEKLNRATKFLHQSRLKPLLKIARPASFSFSRPYISFAILSLNAIALATLLRPAIASLSWEEYRKLANDEQTWREGQPDEKIELLEETLRLNPHHRQAAIMLAQTGWTRRQSMLAGNTSLSSQSQQELQSRAKALALQLVRDYPLQGRGYVFLMPDEVETRRRSLSQSLLEQAKTVRPKDPVVLLIAGKWLLFEGEQEKGFDCWRFAFNHDDDVRRTLISYMLPLFHPEVIVEKLEPSNQALWDLLEEYQFSKNEPGINFIAQLLIERLSSEIRAPNLSEQSLARYYFKLHSLFRIVGADEQAHNAVKQAATQESRNYVYRYNYALSCYRTRRYNDASQAVIWCLKLRPYDQNLQNLMSAIEKQLLLANTPSPARKSDYKNTTH